jgi:hypothetical protein
MYNPGILLYRGDLEYNDTLVDLLYESYDYVMSLEPK